MLCPKCGMEIAEGNSFCTACGAALDAEPVEKTVTVSNEVCIAEPVAEETPKKDLLAPVKPLLEKVEPLLEKYKLFVVGGLGIVACIICIVLLCAIFSGENGYDALKHSIAVEVVDGEVVIVYDAKKAKNTGLEAGSISQTQSSMDGSVLVLLTDNGDLAVVKGTKLTVIEEEVIYFVLSVDGTGIGYVTENDDAYTLSLYNVSSKKTKTVTEWLSDDQIALAPNGDSICYFEQKEDAEDASLMYFKGSKSTKVTSTEVYLVGMSNSGKYIYVIAENEEGSSYLYTCNTKGDKDKIGKCNLPAFYFNEDHTQILFYNAEDGYKTYISTKGKEANKIASSVATPVLPGSVEAYSNSYSKTVPTDNLYNKVYTCRTDSGYNVWYIRKNTDNSVKLVNGVSNVTLSEDAKLVYYVDDGELKVLTVKKGDNASDKAKVLAEDVDSYVVTSDCKKLYYTSDNALYCVNGKTGKGKKTVANDEVSSSLYINGKDVVYYIKDGDAYATKNGSKGKKVVSDATGLSDTANGIVYVETADAIYATSGAKKPSKILTTD